MSAERQQLESSIVALEGQRGLLGHPVVDAAVSALRLKMATLAPVATWAEAAHSRRQVTILFLGVVGSTTLSHSLDPEEIDAVMDGALSRGTTIVDAQRGRLLQYAGDSLLAVFGAEEAQEDAAERAERCGLAVEERESARTACPTSSATGPRREQRPSSSSRRGPCRRHRDRRTGSCATRCRGASGSVTTMRRTWRSRSSKRA